jgi:hypothetical protein
MSTSGFFHSADDFLATFAAVRPSTFTALVLVISLCIYLYARNAINYHVRFPILEDVRNLVE